MAPVNVLVHVKQGKAASFSDSVGSELIYCHSSILLEETSILILLACFFFFSQNIALTHYTGHGVR